MTDDPVKVLTLGRLEPVDLRSLWAHEAWDFTPWLFQNRDYLAEALGIELEFDAAEVAVGRFSLDLSGRDLTNAAVLAVENQLGPSDHGHLGQLLTYTAGTDAATIVWIAPMIYPEHRAALDWLNNNTPEHVRFFGIELKAVRIGNSSPALQLDVVCRPNDWTKASKSAQRGAQPSEKGAAYFRFWELLIQRIAAEHPTWTTARQSSTRSWLIVGYLTRDCGYAFAFTRERRLRHELYIDANDKVRNLAILNAIRTHVATQAPDYLASMTFEELQSRRAKRVATYYPAEADVRNEAEWPQYMEWLLKAGSEMRRALVGFELPRDEHPESDAVAK
jgi:Domain of unknown function (DUF4268)